MDHRTRERQLRALTGTLLPGGNTESLEAFDAEPHRWIERANASEELKHAARSALTKLQTRSEFSPVEMDSLEAIILLEGRPALDVVGNSFAPPLSPWIHLDAAPARTNIERAIRSVGRVELPNHPRLPYVGTGFVVGTNLLMTNRHVAEVFVSGLGVTDLSLRVDLEPVQVDFAREVVPTPPHPFRVTEVLMVHPFWDMALLRVRGLDGLEPLELLAQDPAGLVARDVVVIGYPAFDSRNDAEQQNRIFRGVYEVKRLQPGKVTGRRNTRSFGHDVPALTHEASTLGGNSGSAVVDVLTGKVLGLHFGGAYRISNFGVPAFELKRDPRVLAAGVRFTDDPVPPNAPWLSQWGGLERPRRAPEPPPPPPAQVASQGGTVQLTIPLTISLTVGAATVVPTQTRPSPEPSVSRSSNGHAPRVVSAGGTDVDEARRRARRFDSDEYLNLEQFAQNVESYYADIDPDSDRLLHKLTELLRSTHHTEPRYAPSKEVYPVIDRQPDGTLRSIYSASGHSFSFEELLQADLEVERARQERMQELVAENLFNAEELEAIESLNPFNCEHVVPQSWFSKKEPMRGDLHHLFTCESGCNSFRGNRAYFAFSEEALREDCGESGENRFEPGAGKGAVARAVFYFLARYPDVVGTSKLPADRLPMLLRWHEEDPVTDWERHRNECIFAVQGNRNPFIDHPEWAGLITFTSALARGRGQFGGVEGVPSVNALRN